MTSATVQEKLVKGCLETTVWNDSICKNGPWQRQAYYTPLMEDPRFWGPRLQSVKPIGKFGTDFPPVTSGLRYFSPRDS
jgi:hypothetical protein